MEKISRSNENHLSSELLSTYRINKVLGEGTFDYVVQASRKDNREVVANKVLKHKETLFYKSMRDSLIMREVKALCDLGNHPNIIQLKEVLKDKDDLFMVFEYMYCDLNKYIKRRVLAGFSVSESQIMSYRFQILNGLDHMHCFGYMHRDLKPENLLLKGECIKIADLGSARKFLSSPCSCFTNDITTRWYRTPEILLFGGYYGCEVDMWALGAIMAEMYLGKPIFPGESSKDMIDRICTIMGTPDDDSWTVGYRLAEAKGFVFPQFWKIPLSNLIPQASEAAIDLMDRLLSWDPLKRPSAWDALHHWFFQPCYVASTPCYSDVATDHSTTMVQSSSFGVPNTSCHRLPLVI